VTIFDATVIGAGPAGAAAARLLSSWGHRVALIGKPPRPRSLAESLPPSCAKLFDQLGVRSEIDDAGFIRASGNTVCWAGQDRRVERFDASLTGYQVPRDAFDALLIASAERAGARVILDAAARDAVRDDDEWRISFDSLSGNEEISSRWLFDASGRAGVVARRGFRKSEFAARTTALVAVWETSSPWPTEDDTHTLVESYVGGWAWSVPVSAGRRFVTVMVDPTLTELGGRSKLSGRYVAELERTTMLRELVVGATMIGEPWACDASPYSASRSSDDGLLLIGDAATFVDPLSSFGVKKALASAWLGSIAVHTALLDHAMTTHAVQLFDSREREMYEYLRRQSALLSQEAAGAHIGAFWSGRADAATDLTPSQLDISALRGDPRVLAAFDALKQRDSIQLRVGSAVRFVTRAMVRGHRVVLEDHLAGPGIPDAVRYCRNVDLVLIARIAGQHDQVPDLFDAYNRHAPPAPLPDFLGALSALVGLEILFFA
jgi:flavin-dependent dehydrogenase